MEFLNLDKLLKSEAHIKDLTPKELAVLSTKASGNSDEYTAILIALSRTMREDMTPEDLKKQLFDPAHLKVPIDIVRDYHTSLCDPIQGNKAIVAAFFTATAIWEKIVRDIEVGVDFSFLKTKITDTDEVEFSVNEAAMRRRTPVDKGIIASQFAMVIALTYIGVKEKYPKEVEHICGFAMEKLGPGKEIYLHKFITMTLIVLTYHLSALRMLDNKRLNDWHRVAKLTKDSKLSTIVKSAEEYFN